ncbi:MAG: helix-turn-helix domain-containing protein [Gemmatimonadetes bacterium]|nr:helix-turn-helix domain-containing protein [Gemmatimonadota bacterium]MBK6779933.1 helix-turn-helix domain-containing protein [Gemmatimonadota bacterium]MBK7717550.1 helix-turn-helix domain-containing protein [Gemmatimonadota bacterium]MBK7786927.1 helix-turn-helix domain-containing protein [Gemmatimonadota bacterium]MBK7922194.1 helix-turn-helix domain-containing protein [Gemmatimonadota bacterium]
MRKELFEELVASVKQMKDIQAGRRKPGRVTRAEDLVGTGAGQIVALRRQFGLSQAKFAALLGISTGTLQNWEQGRRAPDGPAKVLLRVAAAHPEALLSVGKPTKRAGHRSRTAA